ncbi:MAG: GNAT family N-acetyltransferase [Niabella sp.]|nr:GNAT family N-acetyltransferase [Niabella sp.]
MSWVNDIPVLSNSYVELLPMAQKHFEELYLAANDARIFDFMPYKGDSPEAFRTLFDKTMALKQRGLRCPFVIFDKKSAMIAGTTSLIDFDALNRKIEVGATWLHPGYWGSRLNIACKLLLFTYCFETLRVVRLQLKTDENNQRSRKAIGKVGARFEGVLRNDMLRNDGTKRNSAYFSIIDEEWAAVKERLEKLLS